MTGKGIEEESRGIKLISKGPTPFCNTESFMRVKARVFEFRDTKKWSGKFTKRENGNRKRSGCIATIS